MTLNCFERIKIEFQKIVNLLDTTSDDKSLPRFVTKKWIKVFDQSEKNYNANKEIRIKKPILRSDLILVMHLLLQKELFLSLIQLMQKQINRWHLKTMHHLSTAFQKLMVYKLTTQKT